MIRAQTIARLSGVVASLGVLVCAGACSTIGSIYYYEPASDSATTVWENPLTQGSSRLSGPDNRIVLTAPGVTLELWSGSWGQGTAWFTGPAFLPVVPIFPISWMLWWMREGLEDKDLRIWITVKDALGAVLIDPTKWVIQSEHGETISARTTEVRSVNPGGWAGFDYPTKGMLLTGFTLQPTLMTADSTAVTFAVVSFRRGKGTVFTFSP